ncbi:MAG: molybdopterin-dependent oxidoreductase, partial [Nitrososphaerota archaeon]|nr:molybdopterin-dependent oxidoreductase [Nitrososphaerota archaeon]
TFGVITSYDSRNNTLTFWSNFQYPNNFFGGMSIPKPLQMQNVDIKFMQNIDIGGSYGNKTNLLWLALSGMMAILTRRPVKFVETRSEHCLTGDCHAFDRFHRVKLGYMNDGRVRAIKLSVVEDIGAYPHIYTPGSILKPLAIINGQYNIPYAFYDVTCVFTNKAPVGAYRGLGAQSGVFPLERMMDRLARKLGIDPADVRRRNLLRGSDFPYRNPSGNIYDSGNYSELLEMVLDSCDYPELKKKCKEARHGSRKLGVGLATGVVPGSGGSLGAHQVESVLLKIGIQGKLFVGLPFPSSGQGHETIIKQLFSQTLGVSEDEIIVGRVNPTTLLPSVGPAADRLTSKLAAVSDLACEKVKQKTVRLAALLTRTDPADLVYDDGLVKSKTTPSQKIAFKQVMKMIEEQKEKMRPEIANELEFAVTYQQLNDVPDEKGRVHRYDTTSSAANVALVEVDSETGMVRLLKYWIAYDCGTVLNRRSVEGQVIGGLAQGIEEAMLSEFVYDDQGQLLNSSFVDYLVIGSVEMPDVVLSNIETPSPRNRLGVKGIGEGGILWSPPAVANAIEDALGSRDVTINEIPIRPKELLASRGF